MSDLVKPSITSPFSLEQEACIWNSLNSLAVAVLESDVSKALELAMQAVKPLGSGDIFVIYQALANYPALQRVAGLGDYHHLPDLLPAEDLAILSEPLWWTTGKRPICALHRSARAAQLSFVASAPLDHPGAAIGLVAVASAQPAYLISPLRVATLMAAFVTSILQTHIQQNQLRDQINEAQSRHRVSQTLEEHLDEGFILLDKKLQIARINPYAEMALGYASREVIGQPVENVLIGPETLFPALEAAQKGSATHNLGDVRLYRRNGEDFLALLRVFPVMDEDKVQEILVLIKDMSEQEQIRRQTEQLEQRAILGEVTASFAHEVRNPINSISTTVQLLALNLPPDDPKQEPINRLLQDCDRLAELFKSVLAFSRPIDYQMEAVDMAVLLHNLLERLRPRITRLKVNYTLQVDENLPKVKGNMRALEQVFMNLINNALQAMRDTGGTLALRIQPVRTPEGFTSVEVSVADTGPGIPREMQERIFQPFFTTERDGTGLGLPISKRIITAHKGNIRLTSFPGGTVFYVQLPMIDS